MLKQSMIYLKLDSEYKKRFKERLHDIHNGGTNGFVAAKKSSSSGPHNGVSGDIATANLMRTVSKSCDDHIDTATDDADYLQHHNGSNGHSNGDSDNYRYHQNDRRGEGSSSSNVLLSNSLNTLLINGNDVDASTSGDDNRAAESTWTTLNGGNAAQHIYDNNPISAENGN